MHGMEERALTASTSAAGTASLADEAREFDRVIRRDAGVVKIARRPGRPTSSPSLEVVWSSEVVGDVDLAAGASSNVDREAGDMEVSGGSDVGGSEVDKSHEDDRGGRCALVDGRGGGGGGGRSRGDGGGDNEGGRRRWHALVEESLFGGSSNGGGGDRSDVLRDDAVGTGDLAKILFGTTRVPTSSCLTLLTKCQDIV